MCVGLERFVKRSHCESLLTRVFTTVFRQKFYMKIKHKVHLDYIHHRDHNEGVFKARVRIVDRYWITVAKETHRTNHPACECT